MNFIQSRLFRELVRFCIVGSLSVGCQFMILVLFIEKLQLYSTLSSAFGFIVGGAINYLLLYYWAFDPEGEHGIVFARYVLVMIFTMSLNVFIFWVFTSIIGVWYVASQSVATCCSAAFSFFFNRQFTFA